MSCEIQIETLAQLGANLLAPDEARALRAHLLKCERCRTAALNFESLHQTIREAPTRPPDRGFVFAIEKRLDQLDREKSAVWSSPKESRLLEWVALSGMIVVAVVGGALMFGSWNPDWSHFQVDLSFVTNSNVWSWVGLSVLTVLALYFAASTFETLGGIRWAKSKPRVQ